LLNEIQVKESTLSKNRLQALAPFRVRSNDPTSTCRPRGEVVRADYALSGGRPMQCWHRHPLWKRENQTRYAPIVKV
jgi:hypothetical protein